MAHNGQVIEYGYDGYGGYDMGWQLNKNQPIYLQLVTELQNRIVSGTYPPGGKIDAVRDLAAEAAVNPNTMQRALAELEQSGLLRTERTAGRFVTEDAELIAAVRRNLAREKIDDFLRDMSTLGYHRADIIALMKETAGGTENSTALLQEIMEGENKHG